jgi:hypothetical protein
MDRSDVHHDDEAWITKYRAALECISAQPSGDIRFRSRLRDGCKIVLLRLRGVLADFRVSNSPKPVPSFGSMPIQPKPFLPTDASTARNSQPEATGKQSTRKVGTMERSRPGSTGARSSRRRA